MNTSQENDSNVRYVIVSPVRDEAQYLDMAIQSVVNQTVRPVQYILVDDGSTDDTLKIIQRWSAKYSWIIAVHHPDTAAGAREDSRRNQRGRRARAAKEILAFYEGFHRHAITDWQFLVKLDGDVGLEPKYFERCFQQFDEDDRRGSGAARYATCKTV